MLKWPKTDITHSYLNLIGPVYANLTVAVTAIRLAPLRLCSPIDSPSQIYTNTLFSDRTIYLNETRLNILQTVLYEFKQIVNNNSVG